MVEEGLYLARLLEEDQVRRVLETVALSLALNHLDLDLDPALCLEIEGTQEVDHTVGVRVP